MQTTRDMVQRRSTALDNGCIIHSIALDISANKAGCASACNTHTALTQQAGISGERANPIVPTCGQPATLHGGGLPALSFVRSVMDKRLTLLRGVLMSVTKLRRFRQQCERQTGKRASGIDIPLLHVLEDICKALRFSKDQQRRVLGRKGVQH